MSTKEKTRIHFVKGLDVLEKKTLVEQFLAGRRSYLSSYAFSNIFLWSGFFDFSFEIIEDCLCIFARNELGCFLYLPPLGRTVPVKMIETCFSLMEELNGRRGVSRIENIDPVQRVWFSEEDFSFVPKNDEYCYYRSEIAALEGNDFKSKRSSYNQFVKNYRYEFLPFEGGMEDECAQLYDVWAASRKSNDEIYNHMIEENRSVHQLARRYFRELELIGRVVKVDDRIKGYTFGFPLGAQMFCVLFEITDPAVKGLPVFIFREFCRDRVVEKFPFINAMDDFGMDNITQTKLSFRPVLRLNSYTVSKR